MLEHFLLKGSDFAGTADWKADQATAERIERLERDITDEKNRSRDCSGSGTCLPTSSAIAGRRG